MPKYPFPTSVSASALSNFKRCEKLSEYYTFQRIVPKEKSGHLTTGGSFAVGIERVRRSYYVEKNDAKKALLDGVRAMWEDFGENEGIGNKNWLTLTHALCAYFDEWPLGKDVLTPMVFANDTAIEFDFAAALPINHPVTGDPMLYSGRSDAICQGHQALWNVDEKTTAGIGPTWASKWQMRSQFIGTKWAVGQYGYVLKGTMVRGIAILKYETKFAEHPAIVSSLMVDRWLESTISTIERMIKCWKDGAFAYNFDDGCNMFNSLCDYATLCQAQDASQWGMYFAQRER